MPETATVDLSDYVVLDIDSNIEPEYLAQLYDLTHDVDRALPDYRVTLEVWGTEVTLSFTKLEEDQTMGKTTKLDTLAGYYSETVKIEVDRLTLLTIVAACVKALKDPVYLVSSKCVLQAALKGFIPLVYHHVPAETLREWDDLTTTGGGADDDLGTEP